MNSIRRSSGDEEPSAKCAKSSLDLEISKTVLWDPRDRSTHHLNYPCMTTSEYLRAKAHVIFESVVNSSSGQTTSKSLNSCWVNGIPALVIRKYLPNYAEKTRSSLSKPLTRPPPRILAKLVSTQDIL
ncbi:hypothetical protein VE03_10784, partial [Pseudogymnoascus sp. 23342-1-I1]